MEQIIKAVNDVKLEGRELNKQKNKVLSFCYELQEQENEIWKDTKYDNYQVSNLGRVRTQDYYVTRTDKRVLHRKGKIITPFEGSKDALMITLRGKQTGGKSQYLYLHRLVYETFKGEINGKIVKHVDGDKQNNRLINLYIKGE